MLYSLSSTNPEHYETISVNITVPWKCEQVKYYVSNINTMSNFLLTTNDDYIIIEINQKEYKVLFENCSNYENNLITQLRNIFHKYIDSTFEINLDTTSNHLYFQYSTTFTIKEASHRVRLLLGLYHSTLPLSDSEEEHILECMSPPITNYANKLYLISLQGQVIVSSKNNLEYAPSVACSIDSFIKHSLPLIKDFDLNPIKTKIQAASLSKLTLTLVDFQFEPVVLLSPLFVTLKIKPCIST